MMDFGFVFSVLPNWVERGIVWLNEFLGTDISTDLSAPIAYGALLPFAALAAYALLRRYSVMLRRFFNNNVLDDDGKAVVGHIKDDLDKLQGDIRKALKRLKPNADVSQILKMLEARIEVTQGLVEDKADENDRDDDKTDVPTQLDRFGRIPKRQMVRLVREKVLSNLWKGHLSESVQSVERKEKRHIYHASLADSEGEIVTVTVRTPYADKLDNELPYAIDIRHGTNTVMRIQWDPASQDDIKNQYTRKRGIWEDAILNWNPRPPEAPRPAATPKVIVKGRQIKPAPKPETRPVVT